MDFQGANKRLRGDSLQSDGIGMAARGRRGEEFDISNEQVNLKTSRKDNAQDAEPRKEFSWDDSAFVDVLPKETGTLEPVRHPVRAKPPPEVINLVDESPGTQVPKTPVNSFFVQRAGTVKKPSQVHLADRLAQIRALNPLAARDFFADPFRNALSGDLAQDPYYKRPEAVPSAMELDENEEHHFNEVVRNKTSTGAERYQTPEENRFKRSQTALPKTAKALQQINAPSPRKLGYSHGRNVSPPSYDHARAERVLGSPFVMKERKKFSSPRAKPGYHSNESTTPRYEDRSRSLHVGPQSQHRAKSISVAAQTPRPQSSHRNQGASLAPPSQSIPAQSGIAYWELDDDGDEESTPLLTALARKRLADASAAKEVSVPTNHLPTKAIQRGPSGFLSANPKLPLRAQDPTKVPQNRAKLDVIDLCSSAENTPVQVTRSTSMKSKMAQTTSLNMPNQNKANSKTPRSRIRPKPAELSTPKTPNLHKSKEPPVIETPEMARQKQVADLIISKELNVERMELDEDLFGEADAESEEAKAKRLEAEAQKQEEIEAKLFADMKKQEAKIAAELEKQRRAAEEEQARLANEEAEREAKRLRRETQRKREEQAKELELEEKRKKTIARIQAERERAEKEAAEKEEQRRTIAEKAATVQAEAEELAKLKAKQELSKKQAFSLASAKKASVTNKEVIPPTSVENEPNKDINISQGEETDDEDSLFISDKPLK